VAVAAFVPLVNVGRAVGPVEGSKTSFEIPTLPGDERIVAVVRNQPKRSGAPGGRVPFELVCRQGARGAKGSREWTVLAWADVLAEPRPGYLAT